MPDFAFTASDPLRGVSEPLRGVSEPFRAEELVLGVNILVLDGNN